MTFYSVSAVIGYAAGYKRLKKYNNNNNNITTYQDGCCSRILLIGFLGPVRDVSVAFVIRLIVSMRSGMFFFDCNSEYVVLTRS